MYLAMTHTRATMGMIAKPITVEVHLSNGLPGFTIVGLPQTAVKESKDRVRSAILTSRFEFPCRRITVNLSPADLPKMGGGFDLPIAIGILAASQQIPLTHLPNLELIGELALDGSLRGVASIIPMLMATKLIHRTAIIATANAEEASWVNHSQVFLADHLRAVCNYLCHQHPLSQPVKPAEIPDSTPSEDWADIKGQTHAKAAMKIAACGGHNILLYGPPGSGKTMLAKRMTTILPALTDQQALECAAVRSIYGHMNTYVHWQTPPFRAPHHTASTVALVGGGNPPKPGEISLAHHGILFLDELPEFQRKVLETLREPLESGHIHISRAAHQIEFPAQFQLIAAMNPCPCGQLGNPFAECLCSPDMVKRYHAKLSAPFLDRIDLQINVPMIPIETLIQPREETSKESPLIRQEVTQIRQAQIARQGCINAQMSTSDCEKYCALEQDEQRYLSKVLVQLKLSARAYYRLLKVARTIADIRQEPTIKIRDIQ